MKELVNIHVASSHVSGTDFVVVMGTVDMVTF